MATNYLKEFLSREGLSQAELARAAKLSDATVNKVCNKKRVPASRTKVRLVQALSRLSNNNTYSVDEIFPEEVEPLSIYFDLDSISAKKAAEIISKLSEFYGAELKLVGFDGVPPTADFDKNKKRKAA